MGVTASTYSIWQDQAVEPGVNHTITGAQADATAAGHKLRQLMLQLDVDWFRVSRCMAEALHDQVSTKAQASQFFQLVTRHAASRIL